VGIALLYSRLQVGHGGVWIVLNLNSIIKYNCKRKTILSEDGQSAYDVLLSIFDDIIVYKVIYLPIMYKVIYSPIYVEPCFKFSILSYNSWIFYTLLTTK